MSQNNDIKVFSSVNNVTVDWEISNFWLQREYNYNSYEMIEYSWPVDRPVILSYNNSNITVHIYDTLDPKIETKNVDTAVYNAIRYWEDRMKNSKPFIHLIRISGYEDFIGIYTQDKKCYPVVDFYSGLREKWSSRKD